MIESLGDILRMIKERFNGIPTGIATHSPGKVIPRIFGLGEVGEKSYRYEISSGRFIESQ